jgi:predicted transcriptional regulator
MTFKQQFTQADILAVLDAQTPKTMTAIATEVGCVRNTVARVLKQLEEQGLVKQVQIKGSNNRAWVRVVNVYEKEGLINELGCACAGNEYAGMKFKIIIYKE